MVISKETKLQKVSSQRTNKMSTTPSYTISDLLLRLRTAIAYMAPHQKNKEQGKLLIEAERVLTAVTAERDALLGATLFCRLSEQAQDLIVRAAMGEFNDSPPPEITDSVKVEIAQWASEPDAARGSHEKGSK